MTRIEQRDAGFSYLESMIALAVLVMAMAIAMTFFVKFGRTMNTESGLLGVQQASRVVLDEIVRSVRQAGYGIRRADVYNSARWQRSIVFASPYELAFNADLDPAIGAIASSVTLDFPGGTSYRGEGIGATQVGAETYVYTLDANDDGSINAADRTEAALRSFNPAAETENNLDLALFVRVHGFDGADYGGTLEPIAPFVYTNATVDITYPDGGTPAPLFTYWLTEDLNGDGILSDAECINDAVGNCPPSSARPPLLYLWGDTDFDGQLSESEKLALKSLEVGSVAWPKNALASSGSYKSTSLLSPIDPNALVTFEFDVADGTKLGPGYHVRIGSGASARTYVIDDVTTSTTPDRVLLSSDPLDAHPIGSPIEVLPTTLLRAIRAVGVTYTTISAQRASVAGKATAGRAGRSGDHGLDYKLAAYHRKIEVLNAGTAANAILDRGASPDDICPLQIFNVCTDTDSARSTRYLSFVGQSALAFVVKDSLDNLVPGVGVTFDGSDDAIGSPLSDTGLTDASGVAQVGYSLTGTLGADTVSAIVTCTDNTGVTHTATARHTVDVYDVQATVVPDCLTTVSNRTGSPSAAFAVEVLSGDGPLEGHALGIGIRLDPDYLPPDPNYAGVAARLMIEGSLAGTTGLDGALAPTDATTDSNGRISGAAELTSDLYGGGARVQLTASPSAYTCNPASGELRANIDYFRLDLDSTVPEPGCTEYAPCTISDHTVRPQALASLSQNGVPVANAPLAFSTRDINPPTDGVETAASVLKPASGVQTDELGEGSVRVLNNGSMLITPETPLRTQVDVSTTGDPAVCNSGSIVSSSPRLELIFETPLSACGVEMEQGWVVPDRTNRFCMHIKNGDEEGGCSLAVRGLQITVHQFGGTSTDPGVIIKKMKGGAITTVPTCSSASAVTLFEDKCHSPKAKLANGEIWMFSGADSCSIPAGAVGPQQYFTLDQIEFENDLSPGQSMDVTVFFECLDDCADGELLSETFRLHTP